MTERDDSDGTADDPDALSDGPDATAEEHAGTADDLDTTSSDDPDHAHHVGENRRHWDEAARLHPNTDHYDVEAFLDGESSLRAIELEVLGDRVRVPRVLANVLDESETTGARPASVSFNSSPAQYALPGVDNDCGVAVAPVEEQRVDIRPVGTQVR